MKFIGISLDEKNLSLAVLHKDKKDISIEKLLTTSLSEAEKYFLSNTSVISGLVGEKILYRHKKLSISSLRKARALLAFQIEELIPFDSSEAVIFPLLQKQKNNTELSLFASRTIYLNQHIAELKHHDIRPDIISCLPAALCRFTRHYFPQTDTLSIIHFDWEYLTFLSIENKILKTSYSFPWGLKSLFNGYVKPDKIDEKLLFQYCDRFFSTSTNYPSELLITGPCHQHLDIIDLLKNKFDKSNFLTLDSEQSLESYAFPIGLALEGIKNDRDTVQFRAGPFYLPEKIKQQKNTIRNLSILSFAISLFCLLIGSHYVKQKEFHLNSNLITPLFEDLKNQKSFDKKVLLEKFYQTEKKISQQKKSFPYALSHPNVTEFLSWVSQQLSERIAKEASEVEIKEVHYHLESYPLLGEKVQPYRPKASLLMTCPNPETARKVYDLLKKDSTFIDPNGKVEWELNNSELKISFYIKNINK